MKKFRFSIWVDRFGKSFNVELFSDNYYHADLQAKAQYPTAYKIIFVGEGN